MLEFGVGAGLVLGTLELGMDSGRKLGIAIREDRGHPVEPWG